MRLWLMFRLNPDRSRQPRSRSSPGGQPAWRAVEPAARPRLQRPRRGRVQPHPRHRDVGRAGGRGRRARGRAGVVVRHRHGGRGGGVYALAPQVVVLPTYSYLGVRSLLAEHAAQGTLELRPVDITDTAAVLAAADGADVVWVETPTNPTLDVADLAGIGAALADDGVHDGRRLDVRHPAAPTAVGPRGGRRDHSGTKFIGGHSDLMIGLCVTADDAVFERLVAARTFQGATPGALEAFLALRGLRTLPVRLAASQATRPSSSNGSAPTPLSTPSRYPGTGAMVSFVCRRRRGGRCAVRHGAGARAGHQPGWGRDDDRAAPEVRRRRPRAAGAAAHERRHRGRGRPVGRPRASAVSRLTVLAGASAARGTCRRAPGTRSARTGRGHRAVQHPAQVGAGTVVDHRRHQRHAQSGASRGREDEDVGQVGDRDAVGNGASEADHRAVAVIGPDHPPRGGELGLDVTALAPPGPVGLGRQERPQHVAIDAPRVVVELVTIDDLAHGARR